MSLQFELLLFLCSKLEQKTVLVLVSSEWLGACIDRHWWKFHLRCAGTFSPKRHDTVPKYYASGFAFSFSHMSSNENWYFCLERLVYRVK